MTAEYTGRGDPARSMELLWGARGRASRGPKPALTVDRIVTAAIAIADAEGLEGLAMRRVAEHLGAGTMSLYRYLPGKAELLDLMVDRVCAETARPEDVPDGWRGRLEHIAAENRRLVERHPWLLEVSMAHPPLGPGVIAKYDYELRALDGIGLSDVEMDSVLTLVTGYVHAAARSGIEAARAPDRTGRTDDEWWTALAPLLEQVQVAERYPLAVRVGTAASEHYNGVSNPEHVFAFGLQRVLDGIEVLVEDRRPPASARGTV
jgi:AcrR family transcriptional regulator